MTAIKKAAVGDQLTSVLSASTWNAFVDAANAHKMRGPNPEPNQSTGDEWPATTIMVKNGSGYNAQRGDILAISSPIITPTTNADEFQLRSGWNTRYPLTSDLGKGVVCAEPIPQNEIGIAYCAGWVSCKVNVPSDGEWIRRCDVVNTSMDRFEAMPEGCNEIIWREGGTGEKWAVVRMGVARHVFMTGVTTGTVTAGSSGSVEFFVDNSLTGYIQSGVRLDRMHGGEQISLGKEVLVGYFPDDQVWRFIGAECE